MSRKPPIAGGKGVHTAEGWHRPPGSRKFHWFIEGGAQCLCMRWGFAFGAELQPDTGNERPGHDDCATCFKKLRARAPVTPEASDPK